MGCFAADPDASMDDVAQAAGVVRRTVYAHFPSREALVDGIAEEAAAALAAAVDRPDPEEPDLALAVAALMTWPVGDRFRVLLSFARKEVGDERIGELIAPLRTRTLAIVERGRRSGGVLRVPAARRPRRDARGAHDGHPRAGQPRHGARRG